MNDEESEQRRRFEEAWEAVKIVRPVHYSLFTFGESVLPYFLVCGDSESKSKSESESKTSVSVARGEVHVQRPMILTPETDRPEFQDFFETPDEESIAQFLLARMAHFSNLKFFNRRSSKQITSEGMEKAVASLDRKLDEQEEDRVAILTAPPHLGGVAILRYAAERVWESSPHNIQELRERGFLP